MAIGDHVIEGRRWPVVSVLGIELNKLSGVMLFKVSNAKESEFSEK